MRVDLVIECADAGFVRTFWSELEKPEIGQVFNFPLGPDGQDVPFTVTTVEEDQYGEITAELKDTDNVLKKDHLWQEPFTCRVLNNKWMPCVKFSERKRQK